jgi:hypothetical protein
MTRAEQLCGGDEYPFIRSRPNSFQHFAFLTNGSGAPPRFFLCKPAVPAHEVAAAESG